MVLPLPSAAAAPAEAICSAKGCRRRGSWALRWNNPRLHPPERRKTWLACQEHRERLTSYLGSRGLLREVEALPDSENQPDTEGIG